MNKNNPYELINVWIESESQLGAPAPQHAVLSTATKDGVPHARVVAIREINPLGFLFFTQLGTRKVSELLVNPLATITFWFELSLREVIIEGQAVPLSPEENEQYWRSYPREAQIRFYSYAPISSKPIASKQLLEAKKATIAATYEHSPLPMSEFYCGFRIIPKRLVFYSYRSDQLSDVIEYCLVDNNWSVSLLSP